MTINSVPSSKARVRIGHLYGDLLNLYADRGNILVLTRRCEWRNIAVEVVSIGVGDRIGSGDFDILFMGGGQDGDQQFLEDLTILPLYLVVKKKQNVLLIFCGKN